MANTLCDQTCSVKALPISGCDLTGPFKILEPQDQEIGGFYVAKESRTTDYETPKL